MIGSNDLLALGAIRALAERGWTVPGDVAVARVNDTDLARMHVPSLTSVSLEADVRGRVRRHDAGPGWPSLTCHHAVTSSSRTWWPASPASPPEAAWPPVPPRQAVPAPGSAHAG